MSIYDKTIQIYFQTYLNTDLGHFHVLLNLKILPLNGQNSAGDGQ